MNKYTFHISNFKEFASQQQHIECWWMEINYSVETLHKLMIVLDEWISNVFKNNAGVSVDVILHLDKDGGVHITCGDNGKIFQWSSPLESERDLPLEERNVGGLGLLIIEKLVTSWQYFRENERNYFTCKILLNEHN